MKDAVSQGEVKKFIWVHTKNIIANVLTKESAPTFLIKEILDYGMLNSDVSTSMPNQNVFDNDVYYGVKEEDGRIEQSNDVPKDMTELERRKEQGKIDKPMIRALLYYRVSQKKCAAVFA